MRLLTTIQWGTETEAIIKAQLISAGIDGTDEYSWEWGIDHNGEYRPIESGLVQHRTDVDGSFSLLAKILQKIGIKL